MIDLKNPFMALKKATTDKKPVEKRIIRHANEKEIINHCLAMLSLSEAGQELLDFAAANDIKYTVLRGRTARDYAPIAHNAYIIVPDTMPIDSADIVIHFIGALREAIQEYEPDLRRIGIEKGESIYAYKEAEKFEDKMLWQTITVYELGKLANNPEFIDSFAAMGYYHLIEGYEKDLTGN